MKKLLNKIKNLFKDPIEIAPAKVEDIKLGILLEDRQRFNDRSTRKLILLLEGERQRKLLLAEYNIKI